MRGWADWNTPRSTTQQRFFFFEWACIAEIHPTTVAAMKILMKIFTAACALVLALAFRTMAATPEQEKAFTDKYKTAMEGKDTATLESFLYTQAKETRGR